MITTQHTHAYWDGTDDSRNSSPRGIYAIITDYGKIVNIAIVDQMHLLTISIFHAMGYLMSDEKSPILSLIFSTCDF